MIELEAGLLEEAKNYLDQTWEDAARDQKLSGILARGVSKLNHIAGAELTYGEGTTNRALLLDYARYALAGATQDFEADFSDQLLGLHIDSEVEAYELEQCGDL